MADPQLLLRQRFAEALERIDPSLAGADPVIRPSQHADFQVNSAMALGKRLGRNPRELADQLLAEVELAGIASQLEVAGPGFINVTLDDAYLAGCLADLRDPRRGVPAAEPAERVVIDYSAPNVAKEMHVGHLRSTVIGDALARTLGFLGNEIIRHNHLGDWGTPFGMLIEHLLDLGEQEAATELSVGDLNGFYKQARTKFDGDEAFADRARARVVALQAGDVETLRLWRLLVDQSELYFSSIYDRMGVTLTDTDYRGESAYNELLDGVVDELRAKGLLVTDDGAECVFPEGFVGREGEPLPLIVRKRDGGYGYAATDLAAIRFRMLDLDATWLLYVVGAPSPSTSRWCSPSPGWPGGWSRRRRAEHVAFGSVLDDGKIFRTRSGETVKLADLIDEAIGRAAEVVATKSPHLDATEQAEVAEAVGVGAIKYRRPGERPRQ
ncbi:MAG: arginine--tRNA ligase [Acidimicrobiales bacterium]